MLARRLPLLLTFAGGCLSGAALIVAFSGEPETSSSPTKQRVARSSPVVAPASAPAIVAPVPALPDDDQDALTEPEPEPEPGSSVADVLVRLEAAYREGLSAAAPATATSGPDPKLTTSTHVEVQPSDDRAPVNVRAETTVVLVPAAPAAPAATPAATNAKPVPPAEVDPQPVVATREEAPPREVTVHIGDKTETTHVGDVYQGDVLQGDVYVVQPPAVGYYVPFQGRHRNARVASPVYPTPGAMPGAIPRRTTFASSWTVPQDRLGYDSALIPMLK
jgi:hypothetical protein